MCRERVNLQACQPLCSTVKFPVLSPDNPPHHGGQLSGLSHWNLH